MRGGGGGGGGTLGETKKVQGDGGVNFYSFGL